MEQSSRDEAHEQRIHDEIIVDAYGPEEQAMSWHYYLSDTLSFPFRARCSAERSISPLRTGDEVEVVKMAPEAECEHEMFAVVHWQHGTVAVPLSQLEGVTVDEDTRQAIDDWHYWIARGYEL